MSKKIKNTSVLIFGLIEIYLNDIIFLSLVFSLFEYVGGIRITVLNCYDPGIVVSLNFLSLTFITPISVASETVVYCSILY